MRWRLYVTVWASFRLDFWSALIKEAGEKLVLAEDADSLAKLRLNVGGALDYYRGLLREMRETSGEDFPHAAKDRRLYADEALEKVSTLQSILMAADPDGSARSLMIGLRALREEFARRLSRVFPGQEPDGRGAGERLRDFEEYFLREKGLSGPQAAAYRLSSLLQRLADVRGREQGLRRELLGCQRCGEAQDKRQAVEARLKSVEAERKGLIDQMRRQLEEVRGIPDPRVFELLKFAWGAQVLRDLVELRRDFETGFLAMQKSIQTGDWSRIKDYVARFSSSPASFGARVKER